MDGSITIKRKVYEGLVLDERGSWVPIAVKLAREQEFLSHLEKGEVYFQKRWMSFEERRPSMGNRPEGEAQQNLPTDRESQPAPFSEKETRQFATLLREERFFPKSADTVEMETKRIILPPMVSNQRVAAEPIVDKGKSSTSAMDAWALARKKGARIKVLVVIGSGIAVVVTGLVLLFVH